MQKFRDRKLLSTSHYRHSLCYFHPLKNLGRLKVCRLQPLFFGRKSEYYGSKKVRHVLNGFSGPLIADQKGTVCERQIFSGQYFCRHFLVKLFKKLTKFAA